MFDAPTNDARSKRTRIKINNHDDLWTIATGGCVVVSSDGYEITFGIVV